MNIVTDQGAVHIGADNTYCHYVLETEKLTNGHWFNSTLSVRGEIYAGDDWKQQVYHEGFKPSASDVGARPSDWVPAWGDVTDKPSTFPPAAHNHDDDYAPKTAVTPIGACMMWPSSSPPSGWVEARGQSTSDMPQAIKDLYGDNLPDMRGEFPRGWSNDRNVDSGRDLLSTQGQAYQSHDHTASLSMNSLGTHRHGSPVHNSASRSNGSRNTANIGYDMDTLERTEYESAGKPSGSVTVNSNGSSETRPRNIAWLFIIYTG